MAEQEKVDSGDTGEGQLEGAATPTTADANAGGQQAEKGAVEPKFTQAEVNRLLGERGKRAAQKALSDLLENLGLESLDDLKTTVEAQRKARENELSEIERLKEQADRLEKERERVRQERDAAIAAARQEKIARAFYEAAAALGAKFPETAMPLSDLSAVTLDESGQVLGVKEQVQALVDAGKIVMQEARPRPANLDAGAGGGQRPGDRPTELTQEELEIASRLGLSAEQYLKYKEK